MTNSKNLFLLSLVTLCFIAVLMLKINCASVIHGTTQDIAINSNPDGARVTVKGVHLATTPAIIELKRKESTILSFEKEGYDPVTVVLKRSTDGWVWGNLLLGGIIGFIVDFSNGAAYKLSPEDINVELKKMNLSTDDLPKEDIVIATTGVKVRIKVENAEIRLKPSLESPVIAKLPLGAVFVSEGKEGEWFRVSFPSEDGLLTLSGFVHISHVEVMN